MTIDPAELGYVFYPFAEGFSIGYSQLDVFVVDADGAEGFVPMELALSTWDDLGPVDELHLDEASDVAPPVPRQRQRARHAAGGHLEGVGLLAHRVGSIEDLRDSTRERCQAVRGDLVAVDGYDQLGTPTGRPEHDLLDVEAGVGDDRGDQPLQPSLPVRAALVPHGGLIHPSHPFAVSRRDPPDRHPVGG